MRRGSSLVPVLAAALLGCQEAPPVVERELREVGIERARALAREQLVLDGHIDMPTRLYLARAETGAPAPDVSGRSPEGDFDWERAREGGLDAAFMSIYVPARFETEGGGKAHAEALIDLVQGLLARHPDKFAPARSPEEVRRNQAAGRFSLALGMENGTPLEGRLENVAHFHERGVRYITLVHSRDNHLGDSSFDRARTHGGLSEFGRQVVAEMNRLGILIDVSHLSDETFWDVLALSRVPVIASHSSCRHFTPGWERNMSDEMIAALADAEGVIQINFGSYFVDDGVRSAREQRGAQMRATLQAHGLKLDTPEGREAARRFYASNPLPEVGAERVADHIDHVVRLVGVEHVGLGSDFDGVGDALPSDLRDVSKYPRLYQILLERGYRDDELAAIASGNVLRVWQAAEDFARRAAEVGA